jgi:hypothetical protein
VPVAVPVKAPVQAPKLVPVQKEIQSRQDALVPKDAQIKTDYRSWKEARPGQSATGKTGYSTNRPQERSDRSADLKSSGHGNSNFSGPRNSQSTGQGNRVR